MGRRRALKAFQSERGFTLVELMIVILVILVISAILLPQFGLARERARKAQCVNNQRNLETAVALWQTDNPGPAISQGEMSATSAPSAGQLSSTPLYTPAASYKEPDDLGAAATTGADYFLSAGGAPSNPIAPSYGHVICIYAWGPGTNPDPWGGIGPITESGTGGTSLNHARGASSSP